MPNPDLVGRSSATRTRGRPPVVDERRAQIVDAFLALVAEHGLEAVTIGAVAESAGVARTAVRHFVGNRPELIDAAVEVVAGRYRETVAGSVGDTPTADALVSFLFSHRWVRERSIDDLAFDALHEQAARDPGTRALIGGVYELMVAELVAALVRDGGGRRSARYEDAAYQVVCLAEHNVALQALGFSAARSRAAGSLARRIAAEAII